MKEKEPLVSVIVPVYNVEKYLRRCLDSVINQTYKKLEIILVDDGSTDRSGEICDEYAKKDKRIKVIHKENGGLSDARNVGIDESRGRYIVFVDSDDEMTHGAIEYLLDLIVKNNVSLAVSAYTLVEKSRSCSGEGYHSEVMTQEVALKRLLLEEGFSVSAWAKIYDRNLFSDIKYPVGKIYEDNGTTYKLFMKCDRIAFGKVATYNYYVRTDSLTRQVFSEKKFSYIIFSDEMANAIAEKYKSLAVAAKVKKINARLSILGQMENSKLSEPMIAMKKKISSYLRSNIKLAFFGEGIPNRTRFALGCLVFGSSFYGLVWRLQYKRRSTID